MKTSIHRFSLASLTAVAMAFVAFASPAYAASDESCRTDLSGAGITFQTCALSAQKTYVIATLERSNAAPTVVAATFVAEPGTDIALHSDRLIQRLWIVSGSALITADEQLRIREAALQHGLASFNPNVRSFVDFLANFVEPNAKLEIFDRATMKHRALREEDESFTMICEYIGLTKTASFSMNGFISNPDLVVGDPATNCRGRCGAGCEQILQWATRQYTQQCLDHDACRDATGEQFGECADEFWAAADGYLFAPDCEERDPAW